MSDYYFQKMCKEAESLMKEYYPTVTEWIVEHTHGNNGIIKFTDVDGEYVEEYIFF